MLSGAFGAGQTPSPWFTIANQFLPRNLHDVIRWARYIALQSPVTSEVLRKFATYPITEFVVDSKDESVRDKYKEIFESFKLREMLHDIGFDFYTIGNVFLSVYFPIHRTLTCPRCKTEYNSRTAGFLEFKNYQFMGKCPNQPVCDYHGAFVRKDTKSLNIKDMNLIKWDPRNIAVNYNPITGQSKYYYRIPNDIKRKIQMGDKLFAGTIPWGFIEAIKNNQDFEFDDNNIFHLRNISSGGSVEGISVPPLISLFSLVFYQATLRKANESIASEFLTPMRIVFPQPQTANSDPAVSISMKNFASNMELAITKHKRDKNYFLIAPVPVGYQSVSGEGRNLLVAQEIDQAEQSILLSLGVSKELLSGQTNWTSSTVGLRMMENTMKSYVTQMERLVTWIMAKSCSYLNVAICKVTFEPFKLMDDEFLKQNLVSLLQTGDVSITTFLESLGLNYDDELKKRMDDLVAKATNEVELKFEVERAQFMAAKGVGDKIDDSTDYQKILAESQQIAEQLSQASPQDTMAMMNRLKATNYPLFVMTEKLMEEMEEKGALGGGGEGDPGTEGEPGEEGAQGAGGASEGGEDEPAGVPGVKQNVKDSTVKAHLPGKNKSGKPGGAKDKKDNSGSMSKSGKPKEKGPK